MDLKEFFKPGEDVSEKMTALLETLTPDETSLTDDDLRKEDCTGCWGGTCANGITG